MASILLAWGEIYTCLRSKRLTTIASTVSLTGRRRLPEVASRGGPYFTEVFKLVHSEGSVPFTTLREEGIDPETGLPYFVFRFLTFGSAPKAHRNTIDLGNRTFDDETEKRHWMKIATEALLVFGWAYNGLKAPHPSYIRVDLDGKIYTLRDFGYTLNSK